MTATKPAPAGRARKELAELKAKAAMGRIVATLKMGRAA